MTNPAEVFKDLLEAAGIGALAVASGWSINLGKEPSAPYTTITIYNTGGLVPNPKWLIDYPSLQIMVRGAPGAYTASWDKAAAIKNALLGLPSQNVAGGDRLVSITMAGDITFVGWDKNNCPKWSLNFRLIVEPASGTNREAL